MSKIKFLQHFSIYCRDLPPMHKFYNEILGLPEMPRPALPLPLATGSRREKTTRSTSPR